MLPAAWMLQTGVSNVGLGQVSRPHSCSGVGGCVSELLNWLRFIVTRKILLLCMKTHEGKSTSIFPVQVLLFMCKTCRRTVKDSAQNALKVAVFGCKIEIFFLHPTPLGAFGASIVAPTALPPRRLWRLDSRAYGASTNPLDPPDGARPLQILLGRTAPAHRSATLLQNTQLCMKMKKIPTILYYV